MRDQSQNRLNANRRLVGAIVPSSVWDSTVAIVVAHEGRVCLLGTGILFSVADQSFVLTAGHVANNTDTLGKTLALSSTSGSFVAVDGTWQCSAGSQLNDPFDIAIHKLTPRSLDKLGAKRFLRLGDVEFAQHDHAAMYALFGYPAHWSRASESDEEPVSLKPFEYITYPFEQAPGSLQNYNPRYHLLLQAQIEKTTLEDGSPVIFRNTRGNVIRFPGDLGGISGCSVWWIGDLREPLESWRIDRARNVGLVISVYQESKAIKAVRWVAVTTLLYEAFPDLRRSIDLYG
jgi:hypothetical protein